MPRLDGGDNQHQHLIRENFLLSNLESARQLFRYGDVKSYRQARKKVNKNWVIDYPVPSKIKKITEETEEEFTFVKYTAVTCTPNEFIENGYYLRPYTHERKTKIMIVMTMYNENERLFLKTITAISKNIANFCRKKKEWGLESWKEIVIVIVADGRSKINQQTLKVIGAMGIYQNEAVRDNVSGKPVIVHLFEYTSKLILDNEFNLQKANNPLQIIFCLKEKNAKKINSHRWAFEAIAPQLNPEICVLIDVGTKPYEDAIYHLWKGNLLFL